MENEILRGEYRKSMVHYRPSGKPVDPDYKQIKSRGVRGEIGRHPDFHIVEFLKKQHERMEKILREIPLSLKTEEVASGKLVYPTLAVSPFIDTNQKTRWTALTSIGDYHNYSIPEIGRKIKQGELQDEPGSIWGNVFILNDRTFIRPYGDEIEIRYKVFSGRSPRGNTRYRTIELHLDGVPRTDIFDF